MSNRYRLITGLSAAVVIVAVLLCFCFISFNNINDVFAFTTSNINSGAVDVGDILLEGYADRADGKVFDEDAMAALYEKLTGKTGAEISDVDALGTLTAAQMRAKNGNKDIVLTMNGQQWTVTHLTKDSSGKTIATLWQASNATTHQWNTWAVNDTSRTYPCNVYGTSYIRSHGLNIGSSYVASNGATSLTKSPQSSTHAYAKLTMPSVKGSLTDFIVKPSAVAYQGTENQTAGGTIGGSVWTLPNEAYGTPSGTVRWYSSGSVNMGTLASKTGYAAWKDDYIWLPSITETGVDESVNGIWALSNNQRSNSANSWLRSGSNYATTNAYYLNAAGNSTDRNVTGSYAVRPALHLNLDLAAEHSGGVALAEPTDVSVEYKGTTLTLDDVADEQKKWFDSNKISITYDGDIKDVGTYKVKAEIKADLAADGLIFVGTPDISAGESDTVRYFNFTVTKKKIGITAALDSGGLPTVTLKNEGDVYSGDTAANGRAPNFGFTYTSSGGQEYDDLPTAVGTYTATAKITNECNYEIDTSNSTITVTYKVDKKSVAKPVLSGQVSKQYSGVAQSFTLQGVTADVSLTLPSGVTYADGSLNVKDAGTYKIGIALKDGGAATIWADGSSASYEVSITITKRPLNITITAPNSWKVGEKPTVTVVGDSLASDKTELHIYYCKSGSAVKYDLDAYKEVVDKTRTIKMPELAQGDYYIGVELFGDKQGNSNYEILTGSVTHTFKVLGNDITFTEDDIKWQYNNTLVTNPAGGLTLTYTGEIFRFGIDSSELAIKGVRIDTTKGTNGYSGDVQAKDARGTPYSVTVYITELDDTYAEFDAQYTLDYTIEKAKYDLSGLSWNYDDSNPLQFIAGKAQSITLTGTLPTGLTATYAGNGNIPVGSYTTTVSFKVSDAVNYYTPVSGDTNSYIGNFEWSKAWRIDKATITCSWKIDNRENAATYNLPILQSVGVIDADSMVTYKYYDYQDGSQGDEVTIADINANINEEHRYLVVAVLKSEHTSNYTLDNDRTDFTVGVNRYPVKLKMDIDGQTLPYRPEGYTPKVTVESAGGLTLDAITLTYYKGVATSGSTDIPVAVGSYRVVAELKYGGDANYIENGEFSFEIVKADIDVSGLKWQYSHGDVTATYDAEQGKWLLADGTEASAFVYDGTAHTVSLIGADSLIAGISVATSGNLSESNAGSYTASATFTYDRNCYNTPEFATALSWTVNKAIVDTSAIVWGYVDKDGNELAYKDAFVYTRISGAAVEYSVKLINLPDALKDCIVISGDYAKSEAGTHRAKYSVDANKFDSVNYEQYVMPSGLDSSFDWVISPRTIDTPVYNNSWAKFDDEVHDFAEMFGLPEDWSEYVSITIKYNGGAYNGLEGEDFESEEGKAYKGYNAGEYKVSFALINGGNNLLFSSRPQQDIPVSVAKDKFIVEGWIDNDEYSQVQGELPSYYDYRYTDEDGNVLTTSDMEPGSYYFREVYVKDKYAGNAEVDGNKRYRFMMPLHGIDQTPVAKPTLPTDGSKVVYYNGSERSFDAATLAELFGLTGFNAEYMEIVYEDADGTAKSGETNAGEYKIKIRFTSGLYCWDNGDGTTSTDDLELTVKIAKAQLPSQWTSGGKVPTISVPESLADCLSNDAFNYTYTDEDGNTVSKSDMAAGKTYSVKATLKPEYAANFEFVDASGNVLPDASVSTSQEFDYSGANGDGNNGGNGSGEITQEYYDLFRLHVIAEYVMIGVTAFIVLLVIVLIVKVNAKKRDRRDNYDRNDSDRASHDDRDNR